MSKQQFEYMLLNRLQSDCYLYLSGGGSLWGITPQGHAEKMVELWQVLRVKPEWLTLSELKTLYHKLTGQELKKF